VLFFYPAALSAGCTKEACHFRDLRAELAAIGAQPVGISMDTVEAQARFDGKESPGMPLLSDVDGAVATRYGSAASTSPRSSGRRSSLPPTAASAGSSRARRAWTATPTRP
jgi:peroxiredoxin